MIIGPPNKGSDYHINGGVANFNSTTFESATFVIALSSATTASTTISNVKFAFGTGPDAVDAGLDPPTPSAEPRWGAMLLLMLGAPLVLALRRFTANRD
jgi:hypothetical protein